MGKAERDVIHQDCYVVMIIESSSHRMPNDDHSKTNSYPVRWSVRPSDRPPNVCLHVLSKVRHRSPLKIQIQAQRRAAVEIAARKLNEDFIHISHWYHITSTVSKRNGMIKQ